MVTVPPFTDAAQFTSESVRVFCLVPKSTKHWESPQLLTSSL